MAPSSLINLEVKDFKLIVKTPVFVDKTSFIKQIIDSEHFLFITAPPKFGKSSIINMIKTFLEIEVDRSGQPITTSNYVDCPVNDTDNYKLFTTHKLNIIKNQVIMDNYFGRTPVISVDFNAYSVDSINQLYDVVKIFKSIVHSSFKDHEYLVYSDKLEENHRHYVKMWCDEHSYKTMVDHLYVSLGLNSLAQYLQIHFNGRKAFFLIDNFDSIIRNASISVKKQEDLKEILKYILFLISDVLKSNNEFVLGAFAAGITDITVLGQAFFENCKFYRFLEDHVFSDLFGLTIKEVDNMFNKFKLKLDPRQIKLAREYYRCYQSIGGHKIFNPFSIFMFLSNGTVQTYFSNIGLPKYISQIISTENVKDIIKSHLNGNTITINNQENITVNEIIDFYISLDQNNTVEPSYALHVLLDWGFLSYVPQSHDAENPKIDVVNIPNEEIKSYLIEIITFS